MLFRAIQSLIWLLSVFVLTAEADEPAFLSFDTNMWPLDQKETTLHIPDKEATFFIQIFPKVQLLADPSTTYDESIMEVTITYSTSLNLVGVDGVDTFASWWDISASGPQGNRYKRAKFWTVFSNYPLGGLIGTLRFNVVSLRRTGIVLLSATGAGKGDTFNGVVVRIVPGSGIADFDGSGKMDFSDFLLFTKHYGAVSGDRKYSREYDLNNDDHISFEDFLIFVNLYSNPSSTDAPDLTVFRPIKNTDVIETSQPFTVTSTVTNRGNKTSPQTTLIFIESEKYRIGSVNVPPLAPSEKFTASVSSLAPSYFGIYSIKTCVETVEGETFENNNCSSPLQAVVVDKTLDSPIWGEVLDCELWQPVVGDPARGRVRGFFYVQKDVQNLELFAYASARTLGGGLKDYPIGDPYYIGDVSAGYGDTFVIGGRSRVIGSTCEFKWSGTVLGKRVEGILK